MYVYIYIKGKLFDRKQITVSYCRWNISWIWGYEILFESGWKIQSVPKAHCVTFLLVNGNICWDTVAGFFFSYWGTPNYISSLAFKSSTRSYWNRCRRRLRSVSYFLRWIWDVSSTFSCLLFILHVCWIRLLLYKTEHTALPFGS